MSTYDNSDALKGLTLGQTTEYISTYTSGLLQGIPRSLNRDELGIIAGQLPFVGEDVWYGYEVSWLNQQGKPIVAVAEFRVPCDTPNIIESKSFKLYLNSFNQSVFSSLDEVTAHLVTDLSATAGGEVKVTLFPAHQCSALEINHLSALCIDDIDLTISSYDFDEKILENLQRKQNTTDNTDGTNIVEEQLVSHLLKSNCLITNQPDWATLYISYKGKALCHETLLRYVISFRRHNEFHEQCVERIYSDLKKYAELEELTVFARYTRRGGLDINPFRSTHKTSAPNARTLRQ